VPAQARRAQHHPIGEHSIPHSAATPAGSSTSCRRRYFLSRRALKPAAHSGMPRWQDLLFIRLSRSANDATDYFQIPTGRVVEVGTQVTI
jgi:K+ transporter